MKLLIFGGSGHMGRALRRHLNPDRYEIRVVTRTPKSPGDLGWDGQTLGPWVGALREADAVINLAGRRVHCRYNEANLREMLDSRIQSTQLLGDAIAACPHPPRVWLQASTATIYAHTLGPANDERTGEIGGTETGVPDVWNFSIKIAKEWERALDEAATPHTRKVAMRSAIMMGIDQDSAFEIFSRFSRWGVGGRIGSGRQYVSWIREADFARAVEFLIEQDGLEGPVNVCAPNPVPQAEFAQGIRHAWGVPFGLPILPWMAAIGAWFMNGDTELVMKSRRVIPTRLSEAGFVFRYPDWPAAAKDLAAQMRSGLP